MKKARKCILGYFAKTESGLMGKYNFFLHKLTVRYIRGCRWYNGLLFICCLVFFHAFNGKHLFPKISPKYDCKCVQELFVGGPGEVGVA